MLDPATAFSLGTYAAQLGWLALLASLFVASARPIAQAAARLVIPALLGAAYVLLIRAGFGEAEGGGLRSIPEVRALFASDSALAAGWLHYLAFDLFVGSWIAGAGIEHRVPVLLIVLALALTFLFGPAGLLFYLVLRLVRLRGGSPEEVP